MKVAGLLCDELRQIAQANTYRDVDAHIRKVSGLAALVDGPKPRRSAVRLPRPLEGAAPVRRLPRAAGCLSELGDRHERQAIDPLPTAQILRIAGRGPIPTL
jgi:hypothetical protein